METMGVDEMQQWDTALNCQRWLWVGMLLGICCAGCGESASGVPEASDATLIEGVVSSLPDRAQSADLFKSIFVAGNVPPDASRQQIGGSQLTLSTPPSIADTTATASVLFRSPNGEESGPVTWEFSKEGNEWKVKSAPVP
jgi:hypothetical protein